MYKTTVSGFWSVVIVLLSYFNATQLHYCCISLIYVISVIKFGSRRTSSLVHSMLLTQIRSTILTTRLYVSGKLSVKRRTWQRSVTFVKLVCILLFYSILGSCLVVLRKIVLYFDACLSEIFYLVINYHLLLSELNFLCCVLCWIWCCFGCLLSMFIYSFFQDLFTKAPNLSPMKKKKKKQSP